MNPKDLLIDDDASVTDALKNVGNKLFPWLEHHTCDACNAVCEPATTYDPNRAAFYDGDAPSWYCSECETHFVREPESGELPTADLYNRE